MRCALGAHRRTVREPVTPGIWACRSIGVALAIAGLADPALWLLWAPAAAILGASEVLVTIRGRSAPAAIHRWWRYDTADKTVVLNQQHTTGA